MLGKALVLLAAPMAMAFAPAAPALRAHQSCAGARGPLSAAAPACRAAAPSVARFPLGIRMAAVESTTRTAGLEALKSDLMTKLSVGSGLKGAADSANRADINEMVLKLETQNPTLEPAESPLLNGVWELLYTGGYGMGFFDSPTREIALALYTGGFRAGLLANFVSKLPGPLATVVELNDVELSIKREQPRVEASASVVVVGSEQKLSLRGELKATSAVRLEETLVKANFFGQSTDLQGPFRTKRSLFTTFLDDDILIVRDETGVPDIWLRKDKVFWSQESEKLDSKSPETWTTSPEYKVNPNKDIEPGWETKVSEDVGPSDY